MKKINFLVIALLLALQAGFSQNPYSIIDLDSTIANIRDVINLSETELIIVGNKKYVIGLPSRIFIAKINLDGEIIWEKDHRGGIPPFNDGNCLCAKADGNYYIAMQMDGSGLLLELNPIGDSIWSFSTSAPGILSNKFGTIKEFPGNGFVLTDLYYDPDQGGVNQGYYYILDPDGLVSLMFEAENRDVYDVQVVSENEFLAAEYDYSHSGEIVKYNINGSALPTDSCSNYSYSDFRLWKIGNKTNDGLYCSGSCYSYPMISGLLTKIDENGQTEFCAIDTTSHYLLSNTQTSDGQIIYSGMIYGLNYADKMVIGHFTSWGSFVPKALINDISQYPTTTNELIIADSYLYFFTQLSVTYTTVMIKIPLDSIVSSINSFHFDQFKVYPNPAKDWVVFEVPGSTMRLGDRNAITISDVSGRLVEEIEIMGNETTWDCRHLSDGIYFYEFRTDIKTYAGKFLIVR